MGRRVIEVEEVRERSGIIMSVRSFDYAPSTAGFGFLEGWEVDERDEELDEKISRARKRPRGGGKHQGWVIRHTGVEVG